MQNPLLLGLCLALALCTDAAAQTRATPANAAKRLLDARTRPTAMHELALAGSDGVRAVLDAFLAAAKRRDAAAATFAAALADLGIATASEIPRLVAAIPLSEEPERSHLLRALANGALLADDEVRRTIAEAIPTWADAGLLYSPAVDRPTFAWYEYVRLVRRLRVTAESRDAGSLQLSIARLQAERVDAGVPGGRRATHYEIEANGAHGQREVLEAIAELALACPDDVTTVVAELAGYLEASTPRPPIVKTEHCAGIGESATNALPAVRWPTLWRYDEWRFTCARAVLTRSTDTAARQLALRHLLYASNTQARLSAIEAVRQWPKPWVAFAADLTACLQSDQRIVVREALVTIAQCRETVQLAAPALEQLANGGDREFAALAQRALADR
ncbi:MAG: hypothetical protein ABIP94_21980 [Planctomycetota bacterium]